MPLRADSTDIRSPDAWDSLGARALGPLLDEGALPVIREEVDTLTAAYGVAGPYASIVHDAWRHSNLLADQLQPIGTLACDVLGVPELCLFHDHLLTKYPGGDAMAWHQDFSYLPLDRACGATLWIALDPATPDNGCLFYAFGSHVDGERRAAWGLQGPGDPRQQLAAIGLGEDDDGEAFPLPAGQGIIHHEYVLHRSPGNRTGAVRRAWALSLVHSDTRWDPAHAPHPRNLDGRYRAGDALESDLPRFRASSPRSTALPPARRDTATTAR